MSNKDYTKYAKINEAVTEENTTMPNVFVTGTVIDPIPETVNPVLVTTLDTVEDEPVDNLPTPEAEPEHKMGRVYGCAKLNVRKEPKFDADVVCTLYCHTDVEINEDQSTDDFYKIYTASGIEGFCMKTYIIMK